MHIRHAWEFFSQASLHNWVESHTSLSILAIGTLRANSFAAYEAFEMRTTCKWGAAPLTSPLNYHSYENSPIFMFFPPPSIHSKEMPEKNSPTFCGIFPLKSEGNARMPAQRCGCVWMCVWVLAQLQSSWLLFNFKAAVCTAWSLLRQRGFLLFQI